MVYLSLTTYTTDPTIINDITTTEAKKLKTSIETKWRQIDNSSCQ